MDLARHNLRQAREVKALQCVLVDTTDRQGPPMKVVAEETRTSEMAGTALAVVAVSLVVAAEVPDAILVLAEVALVMSIPLSRLLQVMH